MPPFIAPPSKKPPIPAITVRQLVDALALYLPTICTYEHHFVDLECDRMLMQTRILMSGKVLPDGPVDFVVTIDEKATTNLNAKLWAHAFAIHIRGGRPRVYFYAIAEPQPNRAIAFFKVERFEQGVPIFERT